MAHRHQTESGIDKRFEPGRPLTQMKGVAVKIEDRRIAGARCVHPGLQSHFVGSLNKNGWSDSQIAAALENSVDTVARTRQRLVEEGLQAALTRKHSPNSARKRIFDGAAEARLIALACSKDRPDGRGRRYRCWKKRSSN